MPEVHCECGARYRAPEAAAGKQGRCRRCGRTLTIPTQTPASTSPLDDLLDLPAAPPTPPPPAAAASPGDASPGAAPSGDAPVEARLLDAGTLRYAARAGGGAGLLTAAGLPDGSYAASVARTFLFCMNGRNVATFIVLWLIMSLQMVLVFGGLCALPAMLIIQFYFMAFCLAAVLGAAGGEEELAQPSITGNWWDELIGPAIKFFVATVAVRVPAFLYLLLVTLPGGLDIPTLLDIFRATLFNTFTGTIQDISAGDATVSALLLVAGQFLWPMVILVVAVAGISSLARLDLILRTIARTFPAYVGAAALTLTCLAIPVTYAWLAQAALQRSVWEVMLLGFFARGLELYATIVAMRVIGLYYHHFKARFAWSWE